MFNHALLAATGVGVVVAIVAVLIVFMLLLVIMTRIKTCPSDKVLVVHGKIGKNKDGTYRSAKCMHGGVTLVVPFLQKYTFLDLTPLSISVDLKSALSKQNIRIDIPSIFTVGISTDPAIMQNAAERLLGLTLQNISELAKDIIFGQLRLVIATMISASRVAVSRNVEGELKKIGLKLINVNVTDISDESGYITALGKEAAAKAINDAKVSVAEEDRKGSVGQANAKMQERISVAEAESAAITGENKSKAEIAQSKAILREKEAESLKIAVSAEKIQEAKALEESYAAQREAEVARAEREKATREADIIVAAEIEKKKMEIDAEAQAEQMRRKARGEADAIFAKMEAEARGIQEKLSRQAEGLADIVKAAGSADEAVRLMITEKLENIVSEQVKAISGLKIDKVTVWDNGENKDGKTSTANFLSGMLKSLPPLEEVYNMAGLSLPKIVAPQKAEDAAAEAKENGAEASVKDKKENK